MPASAETHPREWSIFEQLDTNGNGSLDKDEVIAALERFGEEAMAQQLMDKLDTNKDGMVSFEEFVAGFNKGLMSSMGLKKNSVLALRKGIAKQLKAALGEMTDDDDESTGEQSRVMDFFDLLVKDRKENGAITKKRWKTLLEDSDFAEAFSDRNFVAMMFEAFDSEEKNGTISVKEVVQTLLAVYNPPPTIHLRWLFHAYDMDCSETLNKKELKAMFMSSETLYSDKSEKEKFTKAVNGWVNSLFDEADTDQSGTVTYEECLEAFRKSPDLLDVMGRAAEVARSKSRPGLKKMIMAKNAKEKPNSKKAQAQAAEMLSADDKAAIQEAADEVAAMKRVAQDEFDAMDEATKKAILNRSQMSDLHANDGQLNKKLVLEKEEGEFVPKSEEGNLLMETTEARAERRALKYNIKLVHKILEWWVRMGFSNFQPDLGDKKMGHISSFATRNVDAVRTVDGDERFDDDPRMEGAISEEEYTAMVVCIYDVELRGECTCAEVEAACPEEWEKDSVGHSLMEYGHFYDSIFMLVDLYTETLDVQEYCDYLDRLIDQLCPEVPESQLKMMSEDQKKLLSRWQEPGQDFRYYKPITQDDYYLFHHDEWVTKDGKRVRMAGKKKGKKKKKGSYNGMNMGFTIG